MLIFKNVCFYENILYSLLKNISIFNIIISFVYDKEIKARAARFFLDVYTENNVKLFLFTTHIAKFSRYKNNNKSLNLLPTTPSLTVYSKLSCMPSILQK